MPTVTKEIVTYAISVSQQDWTPNGYYPKGHESVGFSFYSYKPFFVINTRDTRTQEKDGTVTRESIIAYADEEYGVEANTHNGSYRLKETTHTLTTVNETSDLETFVSKSESTRTVIFHESFRTEAQTEKFYLQPKREWDAGEEERDAKWDAIQKEYKERLATEAAELEAELKAEIEAIEIEARSHRFASTKSAFNWLTKQLTHKR